MALPAFEEVFEPGSILPPSIQLSQMLDLVRTVQELDLRIRHVEDEMGKWKLRMQGAIQRFHHLIETSGVVDNEAARVDWQHRLGSLIPELDKISAGFSEPIRSDPRIDKGLKSLRGNPAAQRGYSLRVTKVERIRLLYAEAYEQVRLEIVALIAHLDPESRPNGEVLSSADDIRALFARLG